MFRSGIPHISAHFRRKSAEKCGIPHNSAAEFLSSALCRYTVISETFSNRKCISKKRRSAVILTEHNFWQKNTKKDSNWGFAAPIQATKETASPRRQIPLDFSYNQTCETFSIIAKILYKQKSSRRMDVKKSEKSLCSSLWILLTNRSVCLAFRPRYMGKFLFQTRSAFFRTFRSAVSTIVSLFVPPRGKKAPKSV